jgi:inorganic pyrophosphatase
MADSLYHLDPGPGCPGLVRMIVEVPKNSSNKYEYDSLLGIFRLDRSLFSPVHYPGDYGFIPGTLADDGDPMDVLALTENPSFPGVLIEVRPIGILDMIDNEAGDQKILAVPIGNPRYEQVQTIDDLFPHIRREIEHFFTIYKELEGKKTVTQGWHGQPESQAAIRASRERYLRQQQK